MKKYMMKILLLVSILRLIHVDAQQNAKYATNQNSEEGLGSLVVIPKDHSKPVPYEAAKAWETGDYRNFFKLPCLSETPEERSQFNRNYACSALKWLDIIKNISPILYQDLLAAAKTTHFKIISNFIIWENKPYPNGEIDYKKYEKAAFYNGEIILSTPVMDRIGPLANVLTVEQNQGYILIHELINAAYPNQSVAWKLDLGEVLLQKIIFNQDKKEALLQLTLMDIRYLYGEKDFELVKSILTEIYDLNRSNWNDTFGKNWIDSFEIIYHYFFKLGLSVKDAYAQFLIDAKIKNIDELERKHDEFLRAHYNWNKFIPHENTDFFNYAFIAELSQKLNLNPYSFFILYDFSSHSLQRHFSEPLKQVYDQVFQKEIDLYFDNITLNDLAKQFLHLYTKNGTWDEVGSLVGELESSYIYKSNILDILDQVVGMQQFYKFFSQYDFHLTSFTSYYDDNKQLVQNYFSKKFKQSFEKYGLDFDRSIDIQHWLKSPGAICNDDFEFVVPLPFNEDDGPVKNLV